MKKLIILLFVITLSQFCSSQESQFEQVSRSSWPSLTFPNGDIRLSTQNDKSSRENIHIYSLFNKGDTGLKTCQINLKRWMVYSSSCYANGYAHFFYYDNKGYKKLIVVSVELANMKVTTVVGKAPLGGNFTRNTYAIGDQIFYRIDRSKKAKLHVINWKTGEQVKIPVKIEGASSLTLSSIDIVKNKESILVAIHCLKDKKYTNLLVEYTTSLEQGGIINLGKNNNFVTNFLATYNNESYYISGSYSGKKKHTSSKLFYCQTNNLLEMEINKSYSFLEINNFFEFTEEKKKKKIMKLIENKRTDDIEYDIACHTLVKQDDNFLFLGEGFYTTYGYAGGGYNSSTGVAQGGTKVPSGNKYTHVFLIKFDKEGDILWSNIFRMKAFSKPYRKNLYTKANVASDNTVTLTFPRNSRLETIKIDNNGVIIQ